MARPQERTTSDRRAPKKPGMAMYIPVLLAAMVICGIGLAILAQKNGAAEESNVAEAPPKRNPFADVPAEAPPARKGESTSKYSFVSQAPDGLANNATWKSALALAAEGEKLFEEAAQAKVAGDLAELSDKGRQAREKLSGAFDMTAGWEDELLEKYGDANLEVRQITATRSSWSQKLLWLRKSAAP